ncbi:MAG: hypothetical protein QW291_05880 [Thermofilaceae archaeon]
MTLKWVAIAAISCLTGYHVTPLIAKKMRTINHVRPDVHKPGRPLVPYSGGVALFIAMLSASSLVMLLEPMLLPRVFTVVATFTTAFMIGIVDDFKVLRARVKTALTVFTLAPVFIAHFIWPDQIVFGRPLVPFLGKLRITVIYWLLLPLAVAGPANVINMLDVFNGVMPATTFSAAVALTVGACLKGGWDSALLLAPLVGALIGYLPYNRWPARILNGDSGSLLIGAYIGVAAVILNLEFVALIALLPHIINGILVIGSVGGLKEHREMRGRPVEVLSDYRLAPSTDQNAPLSLTRLILAIDGSMPEQEIVKRLVLLGMISSSLAVISVFFIP